MSARPELSSECLHCSGQVTSAVSGRMPPLLGVFQPYTPPRLLRGALRYRLLPAGALRCGPPSHKIGAGSVIARLAWVLALIPLFSYGRVQRLQGVALASSLPSTSRTAGFAAAIPVIRLCRPAVLLPRWALVAEPENLLVASQSSVVGKIPLQLIAFMVPFCQDSFAVRVMTFCKGWMLDLLVAPAFVITLWAASFVFADPVIGRCTPLVVTHITAPTNWVTALRHHIGRCAVICVIIPLSCHRRSLGGQGVVLAHFVPAALRATIAIAPVENGCLPAVQVAIWALITGPPNFPAILWRNVNGAQVRVGSMVPLLLQGWIKTADYWAFLLCRLAMPC